jgi:hypothetical protein
MNGGTMGKNDTSFGDDAPTRPEDWIGAAEVRAGQRRAHAANAMMFHVYRASNDSSLFAVLPENDVSLLPERPGNGTWRFFKSFLETGQSRIGFSEHEAKSDIRDQGYHLNRIDIEAAVGLAPPKAS